jgi:2-polyprenyl-3-methyl-5-hydroxy-6-metoxy-1,4-benzoquinol methylase
MKIKESLYILKTWKYLMFDYPTINLGPIDYDSYWKEKRGDAMGELSDWQIERAKFTNFQISPRKNLTIVDVGCGDGSILNFLNKQLSFSKMYGVDVSKFALTRAKEFGIYTIETDITKKEMLSSIPRADYILMFEILEHVSHSEEFLLEMYKNSNEGVFFSFPNTGFFVHRFRLFFGKFPLQWKLFPGEHLRFWTKADLLWWLNSLGFKNYKVHYYKGIPFLNKIWPSMCAAGFIVYLPK